MRRRGLSIVELIAVLLAAAILLVVIAMVITPRRPRAYFVKDQATLRELHVASVIVGEECSNPLMPSALPLPSVIESPSMMNSIPAVKAYHEHDHSAALYSYYIAVNACLPEFLISAKEVNPGVRAMEHYDYDAFDRNAGVLWDPSFTMRIDDPEIGANASFAHLAFVGARRDRWRSPDDGVPLFGHRAPRGGVRDGDEYHRSPTLRIRVPDDAWVGAVVFGDGAVRVMTDFVAEGTTYEGRADNIYAAEFDGDEAADDAFLAVSIASTRESVEDVYDPLE